MDLDNLSGSALAAIIIVLMIFLFLSEGDPDLLDAVICNLMDTCSEWATKEDNV